MILGFLCFHFWLFFSLSNCNFGMHTMPLCSCLYTNPYLSLYFVPCTVCSVCVFVERENAVEPNVLLNEMFTLFCDQSSNSAASRRLYSHIQTHIQTHMPAKLARIHKRTKTQTHLVGIITRHKHMHHEFLCSVCYFFRLLK